MIERARKILIVDDEPEIRRFLRASFKLYHHEISEAETGSEALDKAYQEKPDLVILDLGLPDIDGVEVTRQIREISTVPIIILSVRNGENDKIEALDAGADYLTKPFSMGELLARVRVVLRRNEPQISKTLMKSGDLELDIPRHRVTLAGEEIAVVPGNVAYPLQSAHHVAPGGSEVDRSAHDQTFGLLDLSDDLVEPVVETALACLGTLHAGDARLDFLACK